VRHGNCGLVELVEVQQQLVARTPVFYRLEQMDGGAILVGLWNVSFVLLIIMNKKLTLSISHNVVRAYIY
ncbi:hypothetical protein HN873_047232, partial [Arachis hypogaea]